MSDMETYHFSGIITAMNPQNPVVKLCVQGMEQEESGTMRVNATARRSKSWLLFPIIDMED